MKLNTLEGFIPIFKQFECIVAFVITPSDVLRRGGTGFLNLFKFCAIDNNSCSWILEK